MPTFRVRSRTIIFWMLTAVLCQACTHLEHGRDLRQASHLPDRVDITTVPFFPQEDYQCGPAALAMVLNWSGLKIATEDLVETVYTPHRQGSLQPGLVTAARRRGRLAHTFHGPQKLLDEIAAGHPVIVLQNLGPGIYPVWHYAVVVGIDRSADQVILHTGTRASRALGWSRFMFTWERARYWGLVALPPGRLPASADENTYLKAVLGLEQARQWDAATRAYAAALERWPASMGALIGMGNGHIQRGSLPAAEQVLRRAVGLDPGNSDAANNLAHVLARQGKLDEALYWSRRAISNGGANPSVYQQTLREIKTLHRQAR